MEPWFEGKVALVTGGADGIGRASALLFARRGARVMVCDLNRDGGEETVALIRAEGGDARFHHGDVGDPALGPALVAATVAAFGRLDCAFNNAGISHPADVEWDDDAFDQTIRVNLNGVNHCMKAEIPEMLKVGGGTITNTASIMSFMASAEVPLPAYTASKHAVVGLTKAAALKYARQNIRVNALCPGVTLTGMIRTVMGYSPETRATLEALAPLGRMAMPEEMAEAAIWLCSDKSSFVTGHALVVDGGTLAG